MDEYEVIVNDHRSDRTKLNKPLNLDRYRILLVLMLDQLSAVQEEFESNNETAAFTRNFLTSFLVTVLHNNVVRGYRIEELDTIYEAAKNSLLKYEVELDADRN